MKMKKACPFLKRAMALGLVLGAISCGTPNDESASDTESYPSVNSKWASPVISVCWESSADSFASEKQWVQAKVEGQYETKTRVRLIGWGNCTSSSSGIRISVSDSVGANPHTKGLGRYINGVKNGMELNFTFNNWSQSCKNSRKSCIESIGVHEFGHAVGLAHEQNRPDTPSTCKKAPQGGNGDRVVGTWDVNSVMNYCNPVYNGNGNLSAGDVKGVATLYGAL